MRIKVKIKRRDIWFGEMNSGERCPIARAIKRSIRPKPISVVIGGASACVRDHEGNYFLAMMPPDARRFIRLFDLGLQPKLPEPFILDFTPREVCTST